MIYFEQMPHPSLRRYIQKFWYCTAHNLTTTVATIPLLGHELVFNFSDYYQIRRELKSCITLTNPSTWISGLQSKPTISESSGKHEMLGVLFRMDGLKAFTKFNSSDFTNFHIDTAFILGNGILSLSEQIQEADTGRSKIEVLEQFLLRKLKAVDYPLYLNRCLGLFSSDITQKVLIREVCKEVRITNKSLINSFQKFIGITPNKYLQLRSVNNAISMLSQDPNRSLTQLAYDLNFYDQSHFIHSFKSTTGMLPSAFATAVINKKVEKQSPNFMVIEG